MAEGGGNWTLGPKVLIYEAGLKKIAQPKREVGRGLGVFRSLFRLSLRGTDSKPDEILYSVNYGSMEYVPCSLCIYFRRSI